MKHTLRVEVKERTDDAKHSGSDHRQGISAPIFRLSWGTWGREINKVSQLYIVSVYGPRTLCAVLGPPVRSEDARCGLM